MDLQKNNNEYLNTLHKEFNVSQKNISLFEQIIDFPATKKVAVLNGVNELVNSVGISYALIALFRQQVRSGFVLADPISYKEIKENSFFDIQTNVTFRLLWNPIRELRHHHLELVKRGIIKKHLYQKRLVNRDKNGKACYLCKTNIESQNPKEILFAIDLAGELFFIGVNFAFITDNHFTVMHSKHMPQRYRKGVVEALNDIVDKTDGYFRSIFNGLAGASIKEHEHIQITPCSFPIEKIKIEEGNIVYKNNFVKVLKVKYYLPVWLVEGNEKTVVNIVVDSIINEWFKLNKKFNTINIISSKTPDKKVFRTFIILRDKRKLASKGKRGSMAAFEAGGNIVFSCRGINVRGRGIDEKHTFNNADLGLIKEMLTNISPDEKLCLRFERLLTIGRKFKF